MKIKAENITVNKLLKHKLFDVLKNITTDDMNQLGKFMAEMIRKRTRLGYGVKENEQPRYPLRSKRLADSTIEARERKKNKGDLSPETTPKKSNLTMTGKMLDSIRWAAKRLSVRLFIEDSSRQDSNATNREVAGYVSKERPFFKVSDSEVRQIKREAIKLIKASLKK